METPARHRLSGTSKYEEAKEIEAAACRHDLARGHSREMEGEVSRRAAPRRRM